MTEDRHSSALNACLACRKQKRRCTRELPACSLCKRNGRSCEYRGQPTSNAAAARAATRSQSPVDIVASRPTVTLPPTPSTTSTSVPTPHEFPAEFFLDFESFQRRRGSFQTPQLPLPHVIGLHLEASSLAFDVDVYFNSVHTFLPIISKLRMYRQLSTSPKDLNADVSLLLMAIQLHTKPSNCEESTAWELYRLAKTGCSHVEACNIFSVRLLQATILIALYEIEHAIYPAAYLTVGHCARLGHAIGVHDRRRVPQMLNGPTTTTGLEERRRSWWAVIIMERYINLGSRGRPFACEDACPDDLLPIDDRHFDQGELALVQPLAVSANTTVQACPFARTCQTSHLMSRVLRHANDGDSDDDFRYQEAKQLHRTLQALSATISSEAEELSKRSNDVMASLPLFTPMALCYSALLTLYDLYCCAELATANQVTNPSYMEMQKMAIEGLKEVSFQVFKFSQTIISVAELGGLLRMSPFVCDCLYQAAANYTWMVKENGNDDNTSHLSGIKKALKTLGKRWKAAREYRAILDTNEESESLC